MKVHVTIAALCVALTTAAAAQDVPEGQSCGGLVCDLGLFGHKVPSKPAPAAAPPATVVAPTPQTHAAVEEPANAPQKSTVRHRAHALAKTPARPVAATRSTALSRANASATPALPTAPAASSAMASPIAAAAAPPPVPVTPAPAATPARGDTVVLANPYVYTKPLPFMFQSIDPSQQVK